jgi:hypothetical protein
LRDMTGGWDAPEFRTGMRQVFDSEPRLLLLSLHSPGDGILYFVSRGQAYLKEPSPISPDWRGNPVYQVSRGYHTLVTRLLESDGSQTTMDAAYLVMGREDLYPVVRDDLFLFLAFLLVCGVLLLIVMSVQQDTERERAVNAAIRVVPEGPKAVPAPRGAPEPRTAAPAPSLQSPRTGLVWAEHLQPKLTAEIDRAAAADEDVSFARIRIDEPFADARLPMAHGEIARMLKESFPLHDLLFEAGENSYSIILPDTDIDNAVRSLDAFRKKVSEKPLQGKTRTISAGVSSRGGRLIDEPVLREEAETAVAKASREGGDQVIGFRADAARFRQALSSAPA